MSVSYNYRPSYLLAFGIVFIILFIPGFILIMISIYNDYLNNVTIKDQIFFILNLIVLPLITSYGVYNIIRGTNQFEIQFGKMNFKFFKNLKLKIDVPVEEIENINIIHGEIFSAAMPGGFKFKKIEIELKDKEKVYLFIRYKKWISKFLEFLELLKQYCSEKQIQFNESIED